MSKEKKVHVQDRTALKPAPKDDPVEVAVAAAPPAPSVDAILAKLTPEEQEILKGKMRTRRSKAASGTMQNTFNAALAKVAENLADLHKIVLDFGFGDMPFQLSLGTGLDGKPFVDGKRLRHREKKAVAPDAPAAQ